jgi:hypothetical protein
MKKCKFCMTEIDDKAKVCPQCGRKQPSKAKKIVGIVLLALCAIIVIAAIAGGSGDKDKPTSAAGTVETQSPENTDPVAKLSYNKLETVTEPTEGRTNYGSQCINGAIKNTSGKQLSYVGVTFALYDQDGNQIGTAIDNINDLTPDSTWKYTAMTLDTQQFASFELTSVDAW